MWRVHEAGLVPADRTPFEPSASVGEPFSLCRIDADGAHHLGKKDIEEVARDVRRWEKAEQAAIADFFD